MRAYIDFEQDNHHLDDRLYICETPPNKNSGNPPDNYLFSMDMSPKQYYIEYPEEQMEKEKKKVRVNITGLDSESVADIIILLRDEGYEAVLEIDPKFQWVPQPQVPYTPTPPFVTNDKWYTSPPLVTNVYGSFGTDITKITEEDL